MKYCSTRGGEANRSFEEILFATYASDGGLYVPMKVPLFSSDDLLKYASFSFPQICAEILHIYTGIDLVALREMAKIAFGKFNCEEKVNPLPTLIFDDLMLLNTSLGPTLAFKDIGLQMIGLIIDYILRAKNERATIVVETSGDTGPAAIAGVRGCNNVDIHCLYPKGRVSSVQELQMITIPDSNVFVYQTDGDSDEQASVLKELFSDQKFVDDHRICSVNSINWLRIAAQSSYYVWAYLQIYKNKATIGTPVNFIIPTGAFGNAMSGYLAKKMGVPIGNIICATNKNDIVHRTISTGDMSMGANVQTESPAMDIQFAYNLERMLYYICNENPDILNPIMRELERQFAFEKEAKGVQLDSIIVNRIKETFLSCSIDDNRTMQTISEFYSKYKYLLCPHSAIGVCAGLNNFYELSRSIKTVCVLTAHPVKFESCIVKAIGSYPESIPERIAEMQHQPTRFEPLVKTNNNWRSEWIRVIKDKISCSKANIS
eukprot:gene6735-9229_t